MFVLLLQPHDIMKSNGLDKFRLKRMMDYLEYKGYKGSVEYSMEDNCLFGKVQGMSKALILYEGQTLDELRKDFEEGVDSYLEGCKADGIEPA